MNKNLKILIIGFGSIGQRHYRNLLRTGFNNVYVYDIDKQKIRNRQLRKITTLTPETLKDFQVAFICNPNHQHLKTALQCARAGCHLFIEKPLSHNLKGIGELIRICQKKKLINLVGCNMRFHPCLKFIKNYLAKNKLGKIYSISHRFGYYLPYWRPKQDYRKNYAAKKSMGGGIILDDIHEFDLLFWFNNFVPVEKSKFAFAKVSNLEIETEDICQAVFQFKNQVLGFVHCDYLQKKYTRNCLIVGQNGVIEWDFNENIVWLKNQQNKKKLSAVRNFDFNQTYLDEIRYLFSCIKREKKTFNDIKTAQQVLKFCVAKK